MGDAIAESRGHLQMLCADVDGFSLHAAVRCAADDRQALEQLCRYITRQALASERVQTNAAGQVVLKLKTPWRDGTTHLVMSPLEFMQRLAALVPRPRLHLTARRRRWLALVVRIRRRYRLAETPDGQRRCPQGMKEAWGAQSFQGLPAPDRRQSRRGCRKIGLD